MSAILDHLKSVQILRAFYARFYCLFVRFNVLLQFMSGKPRVRHLQSAIFKQDGSALSLRRVYSLRSIYGDQQSAPPDSRTFQLPSRGASAFQQKWRNCGEGGFPFALQTVVVVA